MESTGTAMFPPPLVNMGASSAAQIIKVTDTYTYTQDGVSLPPSSTTTIILNKESSVMDQVD